MAHTTGARAPPQYPQPPRPHPPGCQGYDRRTELPRILPLRPEEIDDESPAGRRSILTKLRRALRAERRRGIAGHWTYDLARHAELLRAYRQELTLSGISDPGRPPAPSGQGLNAARRC